MIFWNYIHLCISKIFAYWYYILKLIWHGAKVILADIIHRKLFTAKPGMCHVSLSQNNNEKFKTKSINSKFEAISSLEILFKFYNGNM